jgi:hypothetical protein
MEPIFILNKDRKNNIRIFPEDWKVKKITNLNNLGFKKWQYSLGNLRKI